MPWGPGSLIKALLPLSFLICESTFVMFLCKVRRDYLGLSLKGKNHLKSSVGTLNWAHTGPRIMPVSTSKNRKPHYSKHWVEYSGESSQVVGKVNPIQILFWYCPMNLVSQKIKLNEVTWLHTRTNIYMNTNMNPSPNKTKFPYWVCDYST